MTVELHRDSLHPSVWDPVATSMNFLNEIAERFPDAISFAAGRPYDGFHDEHDVRRYLGIYLEHLAASGVAPARVRGTLLQYGRTNGVIGDLVARMLATDEDIHVAPEAIAVTAGCQEAMVIALRGLCAAPDDVVLAVEPCYVGLTGAARLLDVDVVPVPERGGVLHPRDVAEIARAVRASGRNPRAFYVVPNFANPSGASLDVASRRELLAVAAEEDLLVLEDDPYGLFGLDDSPRPALKSLDTEGRVIYLGSFAKSCFPGVRVGFLVADQQVIDGRGGRTLLAEELSAVKSMLTVNTSPISQAVVGGFLLDAGCSLKAVAGDKIGHYRRNLRTLLSSLDRHFPADVRAERGISWNAPDGGFFTVVSVRVPADEKLLELSAEQFGVLWTPMRFFYLDGGTHALRLSCSALSGERIDEGVARLADLLAAHG